MGFVPIAETLSFHFHFGGNWKCPEFRNGERTATPLEMETGHPKFRNREFPDL